MKLPNEMKQINEVIRRLNYYEKGLVAGERIKYQPCNLCHISGGNCNKCLAGSGLDACEDGEEARDSIRNAFFCEVEYDKKIIKKWQTELKRRANKRLKEFGSKWRIAWEREE